MSNVFTAGVEIHLIDKVSGALAHVAKQFTSSGTAAQALQARLDKINSTFKSGLIILGGGAALALPLVAATKSAMQLESALARVKIQTGASDAQMKMLNATFDKTANATGIFSKPTIARFASEMYSGGITNINQINKLLPVMAKAADVTKLMSGGKIGANDTLHTLTALAHQFGRYDTKGMEEIANGAVAISLKLPGGMKSLLGTGSTVNVPANRVLGMDPITAMAFQAAVAQTSGSTGAGGKGRMSAANQVNALMRVLPGVFGSGLLTGRSGFAGAVLGLADKYGASTVMKNGKLDFMALQAKFAGFEGMSSLDIAKRMKADLPMLGKKGADLKPIIDRAIATAGKGVPQKQLMAMIMQYMFGSSSTIATLLGDPKFMAIQKTMKAEAEQAIKRNAIEKMQAKIMETLDGQLQRLQTNFGSLSSTIGMQLIPAITPMVTKLGDIVDKVNEFARANPKMVKVAAALIATASAALILGGSLNILKAGFMGLQLFMGPMWKILTIVGSLAMKIGPIIQLATRLIPLFGLVARLVGPLAVITTGVAVLVAASGVLSKLMREHPQFFIHIMARVVHWVEKTNNSFQELIKNLAMVVSWVGAIIGAIGGQIGRQLANNPWTKQLGEQVVKTSADFKQGIDNALKVDGVTAKRDQAYLNSRGMGGVVAAIQGGGQVVNQTNHVTVMPLEGHDHDKCYKHTIKRLSKDMAHQRQASSGNSVGSPINQRGSGRS